MRCAYENIYLHLMHAGLVHFDYIYESWWVCQILWNTVPVRTSFGLRRLGGKTTHQRKVDVDMLNAVKGVLADVSSVSPSSEQRACDRIRGQNLR